MHKKCFPSIAYQQQMEMACVVFAVIYGKQITKAIALAENKCNLCFFSAYKSSRRCTNWI